MDTTEKIRRLCEKFNVLFPKVREQNYLHVYEYLAKGEFSPIPPISIQPFLGPEDLETTLRNIRNGWNFTPYEAITEGLEGIVTAMESGEAFTPVMGTSTGVNDIPSVFVEIVFAPQASGGCPVRNLTCEEILNYDERNCMNLGFMLRIKERIDIMKNLLPKEIQISLPNMQGPFNIAHTLLGSDIFLMVHDRPEMMLSVLQKITGIWIAIHRNLVDIIGDRICRTPNTFYLVAECSCNLISKDVYYRIVRPCDRMIADYLGKIAFHTCNGRHVFEVTLEEFPETVYTESAISMSLVPCASLDESLAKIRELKREVILHAGQELKEQGKEAKVIKDYVLKIKEYPRLMLDFSVMHWGNKDVERVKQLKREIWSFYRGNVLEN